MGAWEGEGEGWRRGQDVAEGTAVAAADWAEPGVFVPAAGPDTRHPRGPGPGAWSRCGGAGIGRPGGVGRGMQRESGPVAGAKTQSLRGATLPYQIDPCCWQQLAPGLDLTV